MSADESKGKIIVLKVIAYPEQLLIKLGILVQAMRYLNTVGADFVTVKIPEDINLCKRGRPMMLQIWCLNMSQRFKEVRQFSFYKGAYGIFLVFDKDTINKIDPYKEIIKEFSQSKQKVGNKKFPAITIFLKDKSEPRENLDKFSDVYQQLKTIAEEKYDILKFSQIIFELDKPWKLRDLLTHASKEFCQFVIDYL